MIPARSLIFPVFLAGALLNDSSGAQQQSRFDHGAFDALLRAHVVNGMVDYDAFARAPEFKSYLNSLARANPEALPRDEQLALWINAYNAYTIELMNRHNERESIRNINKSLGILKLKGPWSERFAVVGGKTYTLDDIEHRIIRKKFSEPRIHFALVCAAMGCPPLRSEAYIGPRLDAQLQEQGRIFLLESPDKNRVDLATRTVYVSFVFTVYKDDFGGTDASIGQFVARWYPTGPERQLLESGRFKLQQTDYDWSINRQRQSGKERP